MKNEYITDIDASKIEVCYISGKKYLDIPGYGKIPCAKKLLENFTTDPSELVIVKMELDDEDTGSDIWVSRTTTKLLGTFELW